MSFTCVATNELYTNVPSGKVFVKIWSTQNSTNFLPLILLHDSLGCVELWRDFPEELCRNLNKTIIAYDRLGFGRSSLRTDLPSIQFISEEAEIYLPQLIKTLGYGKVDLFGHSVGGAMALTFAAQNASMCRSVITESAQAFVEDRTLQGITKAESDFKDSKHFERLKKYHGEKAKWVLSAWTDVWLSQEFSTWSLSATLPKVNCPSLVIHGDRDEYGSARFPEMICQLSGGSTEKQILSGCGHIPHREKRDLVLSLIIKFIHHLA